MTHRPAYLFGYLPTIDDAPAPLCDGDCPPWWALLTMHVAAGECTPFPVMMRFRWHLGHACDLPPNGVLH